MQQDFANNCFANDDMQQDRCQRNTFKQFSKSSFQIKTGVKDAGIEDIFREDAQQGFFWRQVGHFQSKHKTKLWFDYFLERQKFSELNEQNNKNGFQSLWVAIALQKWWHNIAK